MKLTMLGTGSAFVTECYNTCFVLSDKEKYLMVDAGGGNTILKQLKLANFNWKDMRHIIVTHKHIDHLVGMIWMIRSICQNMNQGSYVGEAYIYAHDEVISILRKMADLLLPKKVTRFIDDRLHLVEVKDGQHLDIDGFDITFFDIHSTKAKQFGFSLNYDGKKLTCCGDEPYNEAEFEYSKEATWLLHEAFCLYSEADTYKPYDKHHSTVKDACELAQKLNVKNLVLYHTEDKTVNRKEVYANEGKPYFKGNLFIPDDLETLEL